MSPVAKFKDAVLMEGLEPIKAGSMIFTLPWMRYLQRLKKEKTSKNEKKNFKNQLSHNSHISHNNYSIKSTIA
ncbi:hypothetical protein GCM10027566_04790 [Arachidicoccus ginsenosidivorans]